MARASGSVWDSDITRSLSSLAYRPTTRIVFDEFVNPDYYRKPAVEISKVSYVMGEILDSYYVKQYSVDGYIQRMRPVIPS